MNIGESGTSATLMWVAEHASKVNATKRERMAEADARTQQVEDLNLIKQKIVNAKDKGTKEELDAVKKEIEDFLEKHAGDENIEELREQLRPIQDGLAQATPPGPDPGEYKPNTSLSQDQQRAQEEAHNQRKTAYGENKKKWGDAMEEKTKAIDDLAQVIGQHDQIEIMRITTLDQAENRFYELGSNKIANDGKTVNALIANIRV